MFGVYYVLMCLYFEVMYCESVGWCVGVPLGLLPQLFPSTLHCDLSHVVPTQNHIIIVIFIAAIIIIIIIIPIFNMPSKPRGARPKPHKSVWLVLGADHSKLQYKMRGQPQQSDRGCS